MSADHLLALDVGTQSVRALLFGPDGSLAAKAKVPIEAYVSPHPGWAEKDAESYWTAIGQACTALWEDPAARRDAVAGVALTTQRGTVVVVDRDGRPLRPAIVWLDQRRTPGLPQVGGISGLAFRVLGVRDTVAAFQADAEANWLRVNEPEVWARTAKYLLLSGFLAHRLVGRYVDADAAQVGYLPFDYKRRHWAGRRDWRWRVAPIEAAMLPELVPSGSLLGALTPEAAVAVQAGLATRPDSVPTVATIGVPVMAIAGGRGAARPARRHTRGRGRCRQGVRSPRLGLPSPEPRGALVWHDGDPEHDAAALRGGRSARASVPGRHPGCLEPGDPGLSRLLAGGVVPARVRGSRGGGGAGARGRSR